MLPSKSRRKARRCSSVAIVAPSGMCSWRWVTAMRSVPLGSLTYTAPSIGSSRIVSLASVALRICQRIPRGTVTTSMQKIAKAVSKIAHALPSGVPNT